LRRDPSIGSDPSRAAAWWSALALTLAGAALRLSTLDTRSFWLDETTSVRQALWSIPEMLARMSDNVHPPLFHTLLHYWIVAFGPTEVVVRAFAVTWGIAAIPLVYWVGTTIYGRRVGLIATAIVALSPFFIWYAQEARMYTMMLVFALLSTGAMWKALQRDRARWWVLYALATGAGLMTQYFFGFLVLGQAAFMLLGRENRRRRAMLGWAASLLVASLPLAWWAPQVLAHRDLLRGVSGAFNYGGPSPVFGSHFNELILVPVQWAFGFHSELVTRDLVSIWPLLITLVFVSAGLARRVSTRTWFLIACGVGGATAITVLGFWQPIVLEARYYTAVGVPLVFLTAQAIAEIGRPGRRALVAVLLVIAAVSFADQSFNPDSVVKWDNRVAMGIVADGYKTGDTVLLIPYFVTSIPEYYLPPTVYSSLRSVPQFDAKGLPRNSPAKLAEDLSRQVGPSSRVWLIATWQDIPQIALDRTHTAQWLVGQGFVQKGDHELHRVRVTLYEIAKPPSFFLGGVVAP
jgi:4-amino-4-deoxy-L-arabinose transferase-like glycosyltransferase